MPTDLSGTQALSGVSGVRVKPGVVLTDAMKAFAGKVREQVGFDIVITSGVRTPLRQAQALAQDCRFDVYSQHDLVAELEPLCPDVNAMAAKLQEQVDRGRYLSRHMRSDAVDFRTRGLSAAERAAVINASRELGGKVLDEGDHIHVERITGALESLQTDLVALNRQAEEILGFPPWVLAPLGGGRAGGADAPGPGRSDSAETAASSSTRPVAPNQPEPGKTTMARLNIGKILQFSQLALAAADKGVALELDAEALDEWRLQIDLPGELFDAEIEFADGKTTVGVGPVAVVAGGGDLEARVDLPGPSEVHFGKVDGKFVGPSIRPDTVVARSKRTVAREVARGDFDDHLEDLAQAEQRGRNRPAVLKAIGQRLKRVFAGRKRAESAAE